MKNKKTTQRKTAAATAWRKWRRDRPPPEGSLCLVDFSINFEYVPYFDTYDDEKCEGLSRRYQVAKFENGKFKIPIVTHTCGFDEYNHEIKPWLAYRFAIIQTAG